MAAAMSYYPAQAAANDVHLFTRHDVWPTLRRTDRTASCTHKSLIASHARWDRCSCTCSIPHLDHLIVTEKLIFQQAKHILALCWLHGVQIEDVRSLRGPELDEADVSLALQDTLCSGAWEQQP